VFLYVIAPTKTFRHRPTSRRVSDAGRNPLHDLGPAALALLLALPLTGQEPEAPPAAGPEDPPTVTATLTVTASRGSERRIDELPVSVTVIPRETLETTPAVTLDEVLRTVPSLELPLLPSTAAFPANPSVALRGLGLGDSATRALVLLDGLPMNGAFFGNVFWNRVPKPDLERIEVVRGATSSLFGSFAMGGVVNVLTRPVAPQRTLGFAGLLGSDDTFQGDLYGATELSPRLRVSANLDAFHTGGYFLLDAATRGPIDEEAGSEARSGQVKADATLGADTRLQARIGYFREEHDSDSQLAENDSDTRDFSIGIAGQGGAGHWVADLFFVDEAFSTDNIGVIPPGTRQGEFVSNAHHTPSDDLGGSLRWTRMLAGGETELTLGMDFRSLSGEDAAEIFRAPGELAFRKIGAGAQRSAGLFAEVGWSPGARLELLASLRADRFESRDGRDVTDGVVTTFPDKTFDELNPRLGLRYQLSDPVALRGALYRGFRAPTLAELYRAFGTATFQGRPNPQLDPERLTGAELGLDLVVGKVFGQVTAFYNEARDLVGGVAVAFRPIFILENRNIGEARSRGIELVAEAGLAAGWSLSASYVYTDAEITGNIDDPAIVGNHLEGAPEHAANLSVGGPLGERFDLRLRGRFKSEFFQDSTNETRVPSHAVMDGHLAYRVGERATVFFQVTNLLDRDYVATAFGGLDRFGAPRQVSLGVRLRNR
jgi:outer membrane receptor protein involved in Fe transport